MDFCQLLHKAQKNDQNTSNRARYYSTKYEPPKKIKKENKDLSDNIKKFLAKKEAEERKKREEEQRKKEELLALRSQDKKATRRVNVMIKRTKSANQSVLEDAVDNTHTAVTRAGPEQPDEDDYGYVSQEATALYEKMMEKYSQMPEEPKFNLFKKKVSTNLNSTKDRVKAALEKEREEATQPHRRKRKKKVEDGEEDDKTEDKSNSPERKLDSKQKDVAKPKPKPRPAAPPPLSFTDLLKIAAQKQHEPIVIEEKPQEEEKLYTKKQKKELEREKEWKERRENRQKEGGRDEKAATPSSKPILKPIDTKILEKTLTKSSNGEKPLNKEKLSSSTTKQVKFANSTTGQKSSSDDSIKKPLPIDHKYKNVSKTDDKHKNGANKTNLSSSSRPTMPSNGLINKNLDQKLSKNVPNFKPEARNGLPKKGVPPMASGRPKEFPPKDVLPKGNPKEFPSRDLKPKQFPASDVGGIKRKKPIVANRGRILDDDSEYDSEMDDFIDDGDEGNDYSNYIKEIFGYDKSRYRGIDEDDDNMESSFAQVMKEEVISTKIGIMEDLEDIKKEEEEKRRKAMMKKKMKR